MFYLSKVEKTPEKEMDLTEEDEAAVAQRLDEVAVIRV